MLVFSAATPPAVKSPRHRRTVSSRTPNASAIRDPSNQPASKARRAPGPPRRDHVNRQGARRPERSSSLAVTGDLPAMPYTLRIGADIEPQKTYPLVSQRNLLSLKTRETLPACWRQRHEFAARACGARNSATSADIRSTATTAAIILCRRSCMWSPWARSTLPQSFIALAHVAPQSRDQIERASECLPRPRRARPRDPDPRSAPHWPKAQTSRGRESATSGPGLSVDEFHRSSWHVVVKPLYDESIGHKQLRTALP